MTLATALVGGSLVLLKDAKPYGLWMAGAALLFLVSLIASVIGSRPYRRLTPYHPQEVRQSIRDAVRVKANAADISVVFMVLGLILAIIGAIASQVGRS